MEPSGYPRLWLQYLLFYFTHTHTHTHTYIYIYIEREREREINKSNNKSLLIWKAAPWKKKESRKST